MLMLIVLCILYNKKFNLDMFSIIKIEKKHHLYSTDDYNIITDYYIDYKKINVRSAK